MLPPSNSHWGAESRPPLTQAIFAARPELEGAREDAVAPPGGRTGDLPPLVPRLDLPHPRLERLPERKDPALIRRPRADLGAPRASREVDVRFLGHGFFHRSLDSNLPVQGFPPEEEGCAGASRAL